MLKFKKKKSAKKSASPARPNPPRQNLPKQPAPPRQNPPKQPAPPRQNPPKQPAPPRQNPPKQPAPPRQNPPRRPAPPLNRADPAARAMREKRSAPKRRKFHGGSYILYYLMAGAVAVVVLVILANTVLFNCREITVSGSVRYTADEIISASGLKVGDNLLHIDKKSAENRLVEGLAYIDSATVKKSFPTRIEITVTEAEKWFYISDSGVSAAISRGGKIIEHGAAGSFTVIKGCEPETTDIGEKLTSKTEGKNGIPELILNAAEKAGLRNINEIDISDRFAIKMTVDNRVFIELGTSSEMDAKMIVAAEYVKNHLSPEESVTIMLSNPVKFAVRPNIPETEDIPEDTDSDNSDSDNSGSSGGENPASDSGTSSSPGE